jgi:hypothetical protein
VLTVSKVEVQGGPRAVQFSSLGASETRRAGETLDSDPARVVDGWRGRRSVGNRQEGELRSAGNPWALFPLAVAETAAAPPGLPWPPESQDGHAVHLGFPFSALNEIHPRSPTVQSQLLSLPLGLGFEWIEYRSYDDENPNKSSPMTRRNGSPISVKDLRVTRQLNRALDFRPS